MPKKTHKKNTHANFHSIVQNVQSAQKIYDYLREALTHQDYEYFDKKYIGRFMMREKKYWNREAEKAFEIDVEKIDRLYHVEEYVAGDTQCFELIARLDYDRKGPLYVVLYGMCDAEDGYEESGEGYILFSRDAARFMRQILIDREFNRNVCYLDLMYDSLVRDGVYLKRRIFKSVIKFTLLSTHCNFKSLEPSIQSANDIYNLLKEALYFQHDYEYFDKKYIGAIMTRDEKRYWNDEKVKAFSIDFEKIDRLYYITRDIEKIDQPYYIKRYRQKSNRRQLYKMIAKLDYDEKGPLFVVLSGSCHSNDDDVDDYDFAEMGEGYIWFSRDANFFMKKVLVEEEFNREVTNLTEIYESLVNDDIDVVKSIFNPPLYF